MENNITKLLGLKDVIVTKVDNSGPELLIYLELPRKKHKCPRCGAYTDKIHDYRQQKVKDSKAFGKNTNLILRKRRYVCSKCEKRFQEINTFVPRYYRSTQREIINIINGFRETVSATHIAKEHNVSTTTALRYFDRISLEKYMLPKVLSVDKFKGNSRGEKYQTIVIDAENHITLDILPNRKACDLTKYFLSFPYKERKEVKYLVMDMSTLYYNALKDCFPNAKVITDRYHVIRQALWAMENISVILGMSSKIETAYYLKNEFVEIFHLDDPVKQKLA